MTHSFFNELPKKGQRIAIIYWLKSLLHSRRVQTIDELFEMEISLKELKNKSSLRRFLFRKQKGELGGHSNWFNYINNKYPTVKGIFEHPIWQILTDNTISRVDRSLLQARLLGVCGHLNQPRHNNLGFSTKKILISESRIDKLCMTPSIDVLALLCYFYVQNTYVTKKLVSSYYIEQSIFFTYLVLINRSPLTSIWQETYIGLFRFIHDGAIKNEFADSIRRKNEVGSLLSTVLSHNLINPSSISQPSFHHPLTLCYDA